MSAVFRPGRLPQPAPALGLLGDADLERTLAWRDDQAIRVRDFLAEVMTLVAQLPSARHVVNLCEDRYRFLVAFCAAAVAGQINLLPASRAPQMIADTLHAYPGSYTLAERAPVPAPASLFVIPEFVIPQRRSEPTSVSTIPMLPADRVVAIGFTSGSTGAPKPHPKTWGSFCTGTALNAEVLCGANAPNLVATVPAQHMYGLEMSVLLPLRSRAAIHAGQPFFPADIAAALAELPAPRLLVTTPIHLRALLQAIPTLPPIEAIVTATAPLEAELAALAERRYATRVVELFGSTETCVIAHRRPTHGEPWQLYRGIDLQPQPDGTLAHAAHFAAPTLLQDIVELLPLQQFILCGRNGDLLEIAGKRASLGDLNRRLLAIPGVDDGVVFALDADASGVCRLAALVVAPDLREAGILASLRQRIDPVFLPRPLRRVAALPRNVSGKLPRAELLKLLKA